LASRRSASWQQQASTQRESNSESKAVREV
jgi:hypothetical protein